MIIALDATPLSIGTGGVSRYTAELSIALARRFPNDQYYLISDQEFALPGGSPQNLKRGNGPKNAMERKWWLWGIRKEMERLGASLFHGTDFSVPYTRKIASVMTVHDLSPWMHPDWQPDAARVRRRTPRLLRYGFATAVVTPTEAVRREVAQTFGVARERVFAVPHAAREMFQPVSGLAREPYFLFVGTLEPRKNLSRLIDAWRRVRRECSIDLILVGRTRRDFPQPAEEPGLHILGSVPDEELPGLYSGSIATVYPSLYEGFGLPVLEAMQCGALVITSRDPAIAEVIGEGAAIAVDVTDVETLAEAMLDVARRPRSFAALRERAIARAARFTWQATAERTREVYELAQRLHGKK